MKTASMRMEENTGVAAHIVDLALDLARRELRDDSDRLARDYGERRAQFLAFAALRRVAPEGRAIAQALALGFSPHDAWQAATLSGGFRARGRGAEKRGAGASHWHQPAREQRIIAALAARLARDGTEDRRAALALSEPSRAPMAFPGPAPAHRRSVVFVRRIVAMPFDPPPGRSALDRRGSAS